MLSKTRFKIKFSFTKVNNDLEDYEQMILMSLCQFNIIANSTFSWWGAYLSNAEKILAPKTWFGPNNSHLDTKDIYCDQWIVL